MAVIPLVYIEDVVAEVVGLFVVVVVVVGGGDGVRARVCV